MLFITGHARQPVADVLRLAAHGHAGQGIEGVFRHIGQHLAQARLHKEQGCGDGRRHAVAGLGMGKGLGIGRDEFPAESGVFLCDHTLVVAWRGLARRWLGEKAPHVQLAHFPAHGGLAWRGGQGGQQRVHSRPGQAVNGQTVGQGPPDRGHRLHSGLAPVVVRRLSGRDHGLRGRFRRRRNSGRNGSWNRGAWKPFVRRRRRRAEDRGSAENSAGQTSGENARFDAAAASRTWLRTPEESRRPSPADAWKADRASVRFRGNPTIRSAADSRPAYR